MFKSFIVFLLLFISIQTMNSQNIAYFKEGDESFAEVIINDDLIFTCRVAGLNNSGPYVILLHGFPETSRMWKKLIKDLSKKNFKVIAPDQRGYSKGARPKKVKDYSTYHLTNDVINIANAFGMDNFHLVGHDWGAAVGWAVSKAFNERILSYSALSVPHIDAFSNAIQNDKIQKKKSYYISLFRLRLLPELYFSISNYRNLKSLWSSSSQEEIKDYMSVFSQKNAIKSALNWYRATNLKSETKIGEIEVPTLLIYGNDDMAIASKGVDETHKFINAPYTLKKINSTHWLIQDSYEIVSKQIFDHLEKYNK